MNQILLVSHGDLAKGMLQTVSMLIGELDNIYAFSSYRDDENALLYRINEKIKTFNKSDEIYILTDIFGGSVNNEVLTLLNQPNITLIAGMNLGLVVGIATQADKINESELDRIIQESQQGIINCNAFLAKEMNKEGDDL
ncbi:PTS sugar transporter subunit IIA [Tetragenococcus solitarius]|uniref:PTS fructose transporter subunit IIA n=1 Tax=Tetragenococcus solitarius TaxID=71453 RepID=A0ABN3Y477_9ENTE|nr:PTS fructose transporter subunit IIA [Tetragenococcus solitarius]